VTLLALALVFAGTTPAIAAPTVADPVSTNAVAAVSLPDEGATTASLTSLTRVSDDVVGDGSMVQFEWRSDAPIYSIAVLLTDQVGYSHWLSWYAPGYPTEEPATSGTIETFVSVQEWAAGPSTVTGISYRATESWDMVELDGTGRVLSYPDDLEQPADLAIGDDLAFTVESDVDLSVATSLLSLVRESGATLRNGDGVAIGWTADRPVSQITLYFVDGVGLSHSISSYEWEPTTSGTVFGSIDTTEWAGGETTFAGVDYSSAGWSIFLDADGQVQSKWPEALQDPSSFEPDLDALSFLVESEVDFSTAPALTSVVRTSDSVVAADGEVAFTWESDRPVEEAQLTFLDSMGVSHTVFSYLSGSPATSGEITGIVDAATWSDGPVVFDSASYSGNGWSVAIGPDGTPLYASPSNLAVPSVALDVAALGFEVENSNDISTAPALTSVVRTSAETVVPGDELSFEWTSDRPVSLISLAFLDSVGHTHSVAWSSWGLGSTSGTVTGTVDESWADGSIELTHSYYSGNGWSVQVGPDGRAGSTYPQMLGLPDLSIEPAALRFAVSNTIDTSVPPSLTSLELDSSGVLGDGDELRIRWTSDRPLNSVWGTVVDGLGFRHQVTGPYEPGSTSGVITATVDDDVWGSGTTELATIQYSWGASYSAIAIDSDGSILTKQPSGLKDPDISAIDFASLDARVETAVDLAAVPSFQSAMRTTDDVAEVGETVSIDWTTDRAVTYVAATFIDALGGRHAGAWFGEAATGGTVEVPVDASWAPGAARLVSLSYSTPSGLRMAMDRDGALLEKQPAGVDDPASIEGGLTQLEFSVVNDAEFQTVPVPDPVFTDAACGVDTNLGLEDFEHGYWLVSPANVEGSFEAESHDGTPWRYSSTRGNSYVVNVVFDAGWGTQGRSQWRHAFPPEATDCLVSAGTPLVSGDAIVGRTLTVDPGEWGPEGVALDIRWLRDGVAIPDAESTEYTSSADDLGAAVSVSVTGSKPGYESASASSAPVVIRPREEIDRVKPVATLATPTVHSSTSSAVDIRVDGTDDRGLSRITANIYREGVLVKSTSSPIDGALAATHLASVVLPDGSYTIRYNAADLAGNIAQTGSFPIVVDTVAPAVIATTEVYQAREGGRFAVTVTFSEPIVGASLGQGWYGSGLSYTKVYYRAKAIALDFVDAAGNVGSAALAVKGEIPAAG